MAASILGDRGFHSRREFLRLAAATGSLSLLVFLPQPATGAAPSLTWPAATEVVRRQLALRRGYQVGDLITRGDVEPSFKTLAGLGWLVADRDQILQKILDDGHFLARELRSPAGQKFMRGVSKEPLVYDRLDRLSEMPGGQQLIHDIIPLPNGQKFMAKKPTPGFTDLTILLPKQANGKTPRDKDFNKPTGKIYAENDLVKALEKAWQNRTA